MSKSQNGWPVVAKSACDLEPLIPGIVVPNGVLAGDVAVVFRWLADRYDDVVEHLVPGTCWGWFVKTIEGGDSISNHASATAIDLNADKHPMGQAAAKSFSAGQIMECRAIVKAAGGVLRWGGDYSGRPDSMHWEINASAAAVKALAAKLKEAHVPLTPTDVELIWDHKEKVAGYDRRVGADLSLMEGRRADMQTELEDRFDALEAKLDQVLAALKPAA